MSTVASSNIVSISKAKGSDAASDEAGSWQRVFTKEGVHPFDEIEWKKADAEIRRPDGTVAFEQKGVEVPSWWSQNTINVVADKYFRVVGGIREDSVKQMFSRVTSTLRRWATEQNYFNTEKDSEIFEQELLYSLIHQYGAFNSPVWFNLGVPGRKQAASACFISGIEDSLDAIMAFQRAEVDIFRGGSGSGANLSNLRSSYEKIAAGSYTSGPLSWMAGYDQYAGSMKSGGATRNAAKMVVLDMDHPDILETRDKRPGFIKCKSDEEKLAHSLVKIGYSASYDDPNGAYKRVRFQNANNSVSVPDSFMQAVIDDGSWNTRERKTGKVVHTYRARDVWREVAEAAWVCGDPGVQFTDTINRWHTTPKSGRINASNPCSEFLHVDNTACNLCALNLTKFFDGRKFNYDRFRQAARVFSISQMAIVAKAEYPTDSITKNSHKLRPIGTNYGDLGALLMKLGFGYDSDEGRSVAARLASLMTSTVYAISAKLAARVGAFSDFEKNRDDMLKVMKMHQEADSKINERWNQQRDPLGDDVISYSAESWKEVIQLGEKYGYNISQATLQAPLGTISFLMEMSTTGIEPAFSLVSYKSLVGGGAMKLVASCVRDSLVNLGYADDQVNAICKYIEDNDTIEGSPDLKEEHLPIFDCALPSGNGIRYLTPMAHVKMMAAIQPLITCAQSKTVNLPKSATVEEIADIYREAWRLGLKCVALYRDGCKASQPLSTKKEASEPEAPTTVGLPSVEQIHHGPDRVAAIREKMPNDSPGWRHKFNIDGYTGYLQVNEYPDGRPGEMFIKLGKTGSTIGGLIDGYAKAISLMLQHGVPLPELITSFIDTRFEPAGITNNPDIRFTKSIYDYVFKHLDIRYYEGEYSGLSERISGRSVPPSARPEYLKEEMSRSTDSPSKPVKVSKPLKSSRKNLDAPACSRCGGITQRNGSCYLCPGCGTTTGCS